LSLNQALKLSTKAFRMVFPGWMQCRFALLRRLQKNMALLVGSGPLSQTGVSGITPTRRPPFRPPGTFLMVERNLPGGRLWADQRR